MASTGASSSGTSDAIPKFVDAETSGVILVAEDVGPLVDLDTFSIRNGDVSNAKSLLVRPTIAPRFHWRPIDDLPPRMAVKNVAAYIKTAMAALTAHNPATRGFSAQMIRKAGIILGVARAVCTELYELAANDFIPGEFQTAYYRAMLGADNQVAVYQKVGLQANVTAVLNAPLALTDDEKSVVAAVHMCAIGLLPLQGFSLMMCQHHYLSDAQSQSYKAYFAVERQFWSSQAVNGWWNAEIQDLRDVLWHKAAHPVSISLVTGFAMDPDIAKKVITAGAGSAAARLPAVESEVRAAKTAISLMKTVKPMFLQYGGTLDYGLLQEAIEVVAAFPYKPPQGYMKPVLPARVPVYVVDRATAIEYMEDVRSRNDFIVSYSYGFYSTLSEKSKGLGGAQVNDSLRTAKSLAKLDSNSLAAYRLGELAYEDYVSAKAAQRAKGRYDPPKHVMV